MASLLYRLGRTAFRRWPWFILAWAMLVGGVGAFAAAESKPMSESFSIAGIPSLQAAELQKELFPEAPSIDKQVTGQIVAKAPAGHTLAEEPYKTQLATLAAKVATSPQVAKGTQLASPVVMGPMLTQQLVAAATKQGTPEAVAKANAAALSPLSADGTIGTMSWNFDVENIQDVQQGSKDAINALVADARASGMTVAAGGTGMRPIMMPGGSSEAIGIAIALVVLVLTFGSFVAAGLPIVTAVVGVALGSLCVTAATAFGDIPSTAPSLASMIGLAVGIDYSLFILSRYRSELLHTDDRSHAMGRALGTAGTAVVFAGATVIIALVAMLFSGISMLATMGLAAAVTVFIAACVALTLLPAILGLLKGKAFSGRIRKVQEADEDDHESVNGSVRMGNRIAAAPALWAAAIVVLLVVLAMPIKGLHLGLPSDSTAVTGTDARVSANLLAEGWGPGKNAPMIAVIDARQTPGDAKAKGAAFGQVLTWAAKDPGVANAQIVQANKTGDGAVLMITPRTAPADTATDDLLQRLRDGQSGVETSSATHIGITGMTAIQADISKRMFDALPLYLLVVVGLAFLLLILVFRSLVVPLLATLGFLLSVLATLGAMSGLVQHGWFGIFEKQPLMSVMPTLLIGIVFGLAMDYQVFLTTRMREAYVHGMSARAAIIDGYRHSGRVVTAAAAIMISVFAAFAFADSPLIKEIGVGLALAVFLDAYLVRMTLIPAIMMIIGDKAWWMPKWLDRLVPQFDVEGANLAKHAPSESSVTR